MIKRSLYFGNPAYLSLRDAQLIVRLPEVENLTPNPSPLGEGNNASPHSSPFGEGENAGYELLEKWKKEAVATIPVEDIGVVILDHKQITITQALIEALLDNNVALITCNNQHLPTGLMLNLNGNTLQSERFRHQLDASVPLKKQLWQQTVESKIYNQAQVLKAHKLEYLFLEQLCKKVRSGDEDNTEATAAAFYWKTLATLLTPLRRGDGDEVLSSSPLGEGLGEITSSSPNPSPLKESENTSNTPSPLGTGDATENLFKGAKPSTFENAHNLRLNLKTEAEEKLWQELRNRKIENAKFRRQHPLLNYVADFYCHEYKLIIEVDGGYHLEKDQQEYDKARTQIINEYDIEVVRFTNDEVLNEIDTVIEKIKSSLSPSPKGEGRGEVLSPSPKGEGWGEVFSRNRQGIPPNNLLNYGYAILRAVVARSLVGSGMLPTFGIHHRNKYNAYCLADDIMEPYRPYVDLLIIDLVKQHKTIEEISIEIKKQLLQIPTIDVVINKQKSPLMVAVQRTTASLTKCFEGKEKRIVYPKM